MSFPKIGRYLHRAVARTDGEGGTPSLLDTGTPPGEGEEGGGDVRAPHSSREMRPLSLTAGAAAAQGPLHCVHKN